VQQALQYSVAVAQIIGIFQPFRLVHSVVPSSRSRKGPAFTDTTVDHTSEVSNSAHCRHGCICDGLDVDFVSSEHSSKDQLCQIVLLWGCIGRCVVVCKSRTCRQQSMLWCKKREYRQARKKRG
jgi:hypothetical protein